MMLPDLPHIQLFKGTSIPPRPGELLRKAKSELSLFVPEPDILQDVLIALDEAYTNILEHAGLEKGLHDIAIEAYLDAHGLNLVLTDNGVHGSQLHFSEPSQTDSKRLLHKVVATGGSLGLLLIRKTMHMICYEISRDGYNRLHLVKKILKEPKMEEELIAELLVKEEVGFITLRGFVNMDTTDYLSERLQDFIAREKVSRFLIQAENLDYVSSAGVGVFVDLYDRFETSGGKVCFVKLKPEVRRVFELVGFLAFFGDFDDENKAVEFLNS